MLNIFYLDGILIILFNILYHLQCGSATCPPVCRTLPTWRTSGRRPRPQGPSLVRVASLVHSQHTLVGPHRGCTVRVTSLVHRRTHTAALALSVDCCVQKFSCSSLLCNVCRFHLVHVASLSVMCSVYIFIFLTFAIIHTHIRTHILTLTQTQIHTHIHRHLHMFTHRHT